MKWDGWNIWRGLKKNMILNHPIKKNWKSTDVPTLWWRQFQSYNFIKNCFILYIRIVFQVLLFKAFYPLELYKLAGEFKDMILSFCLITVKKLKPFWN